MLWVPPDNAFALEFGFTVNHQRIGAVLLEIVSLLAIENKIRREKTKCRIPAQLSEVASDLHIRTASQIGIRFANRAATEGRAMNDQRRFVLAKSFAQGAVIECSHPSGHEYSNSSGGIGAPGMRLNTKET